MRERILLAIVAALSVHLPPVLFAAEPKAVELLRLPAFAMERTSLAGGAMADLKSLTDGDPNTLVSVEVSGTEPLTIVYGFGGTTVTLEKLAVNVPPASKTGSPPERVDLLVSVVSPHTGFQSVRTDALKPSPKPLELDFMPLGTKWVMLRFTPSAKSERMVLGDVGLTGYEGPPVSRYKFKEAPAKAFDVLQRLQKSTSLQVDISRDEADLFDDAADGKLDRWSFAEAALLASGVLEAAKRKEYLARLDKHETEVRKSLATGGVARANPL